MPARVVPSVVFLFCVLSSVLEAQVVRWNYVGEITVVNDPDGAFPDLQPGDLIEGHFQFDTSIESTTIPGLATLFFMGGEEGYYGFNGISIRATSSATGDVFAPQLAANPDLDFSVLMTDGPLPNTSIASITGQLEPWDGYPGTVPVFSVGFLGIEPLTTDKLPGELDLSDFLQTFAIIEDLGSDVSPASLDAEILELTRVELIQGDFNTDFALTAEDIDILTMAVAGNSPRTFYDMNGDGMVNGDDRAAWILAQNTYLGDSNLDGEFNSADLIQIFRAGEYEDNVPENSTWATGDWSGDFEFDSGDLIVAFQDGGYEQGPRPSVSSVPEPSAAAFIVAAAGVLSIYRRRSLA